MAVAACQRVKMATCERCPLLSSCCPLLVGFSGSLPPSLSLSPSLLGTKSWPQCQAALASPVWISSSSPLVAIFSVLSSSCSSIAFLLSFFGSPLPWLPAYLRSCSSYHTLVFLFSSLPLPLFSSWHAPLMLSSCPFGVVRSQLVFLLSSWCVRVVFLPSSFCPLLASLCSPLGFLLSCCLRCFPKQAGAAAAHDNNNSCQLSCLGSMLA